MTKKPPAPASNQPSNQPSNPAPNPAPHPARNPAPRPALPRRTLGRHGDEPAEEFGGPTDVDAWVAEARRRAAEPEPASPAPLAGRDALLPPAAQPAARPGAAPEPARARTGRATIPSLSELMPRSVPSSVRPAPAEPSGPTGTPTAPSKTPSTAPSKAAATATSKARKPKKHKPDKPAKGQDASHAVELVVPISKSLRKRLKAKAATSGMSPEEATALLVSVWVDG